MKKITLSALFTVAAALFAQRANAQVFVVAPTFVSEVTVCGLVNGYYTSACMTQLLVADAFIGAAAITERAEMLRVVHGCEIIRGGVIFYEPGCLGRLTVSGHPFWGRVGHHHDLYYRQYGYYYHRRPPIAERRYYEERREERRYEREYEHRHYEDHRYGRYGYLLSPDADGVNKMVDAMLGSPAEADERQCDRNSSNVRTASAEDSIFRKDGAGASATGGSTY